ncbi:MULTISPECIES: PadR family transcriptional regulator [Halorussus]|uniref:PadR family transcriptional regulator n=1 Tax=Halorussus TaxID=1070314 RepID=UPI000E212B58|nr:MULTISPECIES: PadR family transcriptional regulator [Halorussus]NHN59005.1 PadR family transcriptional regulator [Halorussus sp. JP-T4]
MTRWLPSGRRRDLCVLLYDDGPLRGQSLKTRLEAHYDAHIDSQSFYGALKSLEEKGFVEKRTEGIHEAYALTEAGERRVREHFEWMREKVAE